MELEKAIQVKINELVDSGAVDKMIESHLSKSIDSVLKDIFNDYGEFGKKLKAAIGTKMELNLDRLNIESYTSMVLQVIENSINGSVMEFSKGRIQKHVSDVLALIKKKNWLLSEVVLKYRDSIYGESPTVDLEYKEESYANYIQLGEHNNSSYSRSGSKSHEITIHLNKKENNKVFAVSNHGKHISPLNENPHKWEIFLMQLWVNECTIEIDLDTAECVANREYN